MKPMNIFNMDETGVTIVHKGGKVVTEIGRRNVWAITAGEKGKTHTILTCVSASGFLLPPFLIYPRQRITENLKEGAIAGTVFHCSDSGWVNTDLFLVWLEFFAQSIPPSRPVLLILDGHSSHVSIEAIEFARSNNIHMLCLPAHTTHILQPLDVGVFKSFKSFYYKACKKRMAEHPNRVITTEQIASLVGVAWPQSITPVNIMSGFKKCGIYPLNPGEVTDRQMAPSTLFTTDGLPSTTPDTSPVTRSDATPDASSVTRSDATPDASSVTRSDATPDASSVTRSDATPDASSVTRSDATPDASSVTRSDATPDVSSVTRSDATPDASSVTRSDATPDVSSVTRSDATPDASSVTRSDVSERDSEFRKKYEEGYDIYDHDYLQWIRDNNLTLPTRDPPACTSGSSQALSTVSSLHCGGSTGSSLSEILALPKPLAPKKRGRKAVNAKASCITDSEVLEELKQKKKKKRKRSRRRQ